MTHSEFVELWPLWTYLFGFVSTTVGWFAKGTYNGVDTADVDFIAPVMGGSLFWPFVWLGAGGIALGKNLKSRKQKAIVRAKEQKRLAEKEAKLLSEAGF